jgi:hypothetical protein
MTIDNQSSEKKYFVHFIYAGTFLLAVLLVIGYLAWNKYEIAVAAQVKKSRMLMCVANAQENYSAAWAGACKTNAKAIQTNLANCINGSEKRARFIADGDSFVNYKNLLANYVAQCKSAYGTPNPKPTCLLPSSTAKSLNTGLQQQEKLCKSIS